MRTTLDIPENLHRIALGLAHHTGRSLSQTVADLMQRALDMSANPTRISAPHRLHPRTHLPVAQSSRPVTADDVKRLDDGE